MSVSERIRVDRIRVTALIGRLIAVTFVILESATGPNSRAHGLNVEGNALLDFMNGVTSNRTIDTFQSWNAADDTPCAWVGINCIQIRGDQRVVGITLTSNELGGAISPRLGDLDYLQTVDLHSNNLTGQIPRELFKLINLTRLDLSNNNIAGALPVGLGSNLTQLEQLDLSTNQFTGTIPDDFDKLTTLQKTLNLSNNRFSGAIPKSLASLGRVFIDLSNNNLSGPIPSDSYFQSLGPAAFTGNPGLCGSPLETECGSSSPAPSSASIAATISRDGERRRLRRGAVIGVAIACGALTLLVASLIVKLAVTGERFNVTFSRSNTRLRRFLCPYGSGTGEEDEDDQGELIHLTGALSFTLEELLRASAYVLGKSSVGIVYKAVLDDGTVVAVRRLGLEGGEQRHKEFQSEVKAIAQVRHPNLVCLHSYSWSVDEKLLICDFLPNGTLETALHGGQSEGWKGPLSWEARIRIARGVAKALARIHDCSSRKQYAHGDINPSNILLDAFLEPRIANFGLQRLLALAQPAPITEFGSTRGENGTRISVAQLPTGGGAPVFMGVYHAPEIVRPSQKGDVYSFGVVVLELLTGRSPFTQLAAAGAGAGSGGSELDVVSWMRVALQEKRALSEVLDPHLTKDANNQHIHKMVETLQMALACIAVSPESRPKMKQVAEFFELQASNS